MTKRLFFYHDFHLRERYIDTLRSEPFCYLQVDGIFYLIGERVFPCPYIQHKLQVKISEFTQKYLRGGFFEQVPGFLNRLLRNVKQEIFYL